MLQPHEYLTLWDILMMPIILAAIFLYTVKIRQSNIDKYPYYKYLIPGLFFKILGGIAFNLIYMFYYPGGDTIQYFISSKAFVNLFLKEPLVALSIVLGNNTQENFSHFTIDTGFPSYLYFDDNANSVSRLSFIFVLLSFNKMYVATVFLDVFAFVGFWKFYKMACELFPSLYKQFAWAIFFIPSVFFWGGGIMKDTYTISSALWLTTNFYYIFINKRNVITNILLLLMNIYILISLKPYVLVALLPSCVLWILYNPVKRIKGGFLKIIVIPILFVLGILAGISLLSIFEKSLGTYGNIENIKKKAIITKEDLIRKELYGENFFDIGKIEFTPIGLIQKFPLAVTAGLFRPFIWEARNPVMILSGLENLVYLFFILYMFYRIGIFNFFKYLFSEPFALYSFLFAIIFVFSVGLTTANFGALVRYKIPALPFLTISLFIIWHTHVTNKKEKQAALIASKTDNLAYNQ